MNNTTNHNTKQWMLLNYIKYYVLVIFIKLKNDTTKNLHFELKLKWNLKM